MARLVFAATLILAASLVGCGDVASVFVSRDGCRGRVDPHVAITQEITPHGVKCTIEYRE